MYIFFREAGREKEERVRELIMREPKHTFNRRRYRDNKWTLASRSLLHVISLERFAIRNIFFLHANKQKVMGNKR